MRRLKLQVQMTVDGFIAGAKGEMDCMTFSWDDALNQYVENLTKNVDCIVLGRKLAEGFIPHWAGVAADPTNPEQASGRLFTETSKVVFSRTLKRSEWANTVLAQGDLVSEIQALKQAAGRDIIAYGGSGFVSALIQAGLIDEYHLFVNPVAIGEGMPIFREVGARHPLVLQKATPFACGIVGLHYEPSRT